DLAAGSRELQRQRVIGLVLGDRMVLPDRLYVLAVVAAAGERQRRQNGDREDAQESRHRIPGPLPPRGREDGVVPQPALPSAAWACFTRASKAAGSRAARSAITLRSMAMPAFLMPAMNCE